MTETKHHIYGPSTLKNREVCPGWTNDRDADQTKANEGTKMHLAAETGDLSGLDAEQTEQVQKCLTYIKPLEARAIENHKEVRLRILDGETFGTADRVFICKMVNRGKHGDIVDYKMGRNGVDDPIENRQGFSYVLGVFERWDVDSVTVHFLLPRRDEVLRATFFRSDVPRLAKIIRSIIARCKVYAQTQDPNMLRATEFGCAYCGNRSRVEAGPDGKPQVVLCPALGGVGLAMAKKYAPLEIVEEVHSSKITDPAKAIPLYIAVLILEKLVGSAKKHITALAKENGGLADANGKMAFVIRERKGNTRITDSVAAHGILSQLLDPVELASCATYNYNDVLKLVSEKAEKGKKTEAARQLYVALSNAEYVVQGEPTTYLQRNKEEEADAAVELPSV